MVRLLLCLIMVPVLTLGQQNPSYTISEYQGGSGPINTENGYGRLIKSTTYNAQDSVLRFIHYSSTGDQQRAVFYDRDTLNRVRHFREISYDSRYWNDLKLGYSYQCWDCDTLDKYFYYENDTLTQIDVFRRNQLNSSTQFLYDTLDHRYIKQAHIKKGSSSYLSFEEALNSATNQKHIRYWNSAGNLVGERFSAHYDDGTLFYKARRTYPDSLLFFETINIHGTKVELEDYITSILGDFQSAHSVRIFDSTGLLATIGYLDENKKFHELRREWYDERGQLILEEFNGNQRREYHYDSTGMLMKTAFYRPHPQNNSYRKVFYTYKNDLLTRMDIHLYDSLYERHDYFYNPSRLLVKETIETVGSQSKNHHILYSYNSKNKCIKKTDIMEVPEIMLSGVGTYAVTYSKGKSNQVSPKNYPGYKETREETRYRYDSLNRLVAEYGTADAPLRINYFQGNFWFVKSYATGMDYYGVDKPDTISIKEVNGEQFVTFRYSFLTDPKKENDSIFTYWKDIHRIELIAADGSLKEVTEYVHGGKLLRYHWSESEKLNLIKSYAYSADTMRISENLFNKSALVHRDVSDGKGNNLQGIEFNNGYFYAAYRNFFEEGKLVRKVRSLGIFGDQRIYTYDVNGILETESYYSSIGELSFVIKYENDGKHIVKESTEVPEEVVLLHVFVKEIL